VSLRFSASNGAAPAAGRRVSAAELAEAHGLLLVDLTSVEIEAEAAAEIPVRVLERVEAVPYRFDGDRLRVAIADPGNLETVDELRLASRYPLELVVAPITQIRSELRRLIARSPNLNLPPIPMEADLVEDGGAPVAFVDEESVQVRLVDSIITRAVESRASDVHFIPTGDSLAVRIRVDGVVHDLERIPNAEAPGVVSRLKVLAKLDIAEHRRPQDGRISLQPDGRRELDIRVAVLPTVGGEGVVLRLLEKARSAPTLSDIGLSFQMQMDIERLNHTSLGAFLVTGPTGSGKSTTLYAALDDINRPGINVITVEDPVEYRLPEIFQVEVHPRAGLTFAGALRGILRADPDVIMVGEIRDNETAGIALEAALTGHFVLSTLHTNDPPSALTRLIDIGVEPHLAGAAVTAVLTQRLVRRVCTDCRVAVEASEEQLTSIGFSEEQIARGVTMYEGRGCDMCSEGYRGRVGVFQLMPVSDEIAELTTRRPSRDTLKHAAFAAGMRSLREDGLDKVARGLTTLGELERALP
jgi:type IV pilus assembly protein PilB